MSMIPDICTMHILLAAATTFEIQPAIDFLEGYLAGHGRSGNSEGHQNPGWQEPPHGRQDVHQTSVLITGIGSLPATWSLTNRIQTVRPDLILQAGIAGCFTGRIPGEVVIVEEEQLADLGVWEEKRFKTVFDLRLTDKDATPFTGGRLLNPYTRLMEFCGLMRVKGLTVNEITTDPVRIGWYQQNEPAVVESMEGAALHYVCLQENIPFLQLRSISNAVGERDKTKWDIPAAIRQLNEQLIRLLKCPDLHNPDLLKKFR